MATKIYWINLLHRSFLILVRAFFDFFWANGSKVRPVKDDILKQSAVELAKKIRSKELTSLQVVKAFINRIEEINPLLNCVVDNRFDEALKEAADVDALVASGTISEEELERTKPFLGVPISTKDSIAINGMLHTGGILARKNVRANVDSDVIALMRKAGAIPFALTNVSECCMWWESHNPVHGRSNNPYDTNRIVGGSSGGEACLLGASGSPFGIGSDIGGSIRMPAFFNGIFGHKPSTSIVSIAGQWPRPVDAELNKFIGVGPMSRFACDLNPMLRILSGDNVSKLKLDTKVDIRKLRIFYQYDNGDGYLVSPVDDDIRKAMEKVVKHFENICEIKPEPMQIGLLKKGLEIWMANMKTADTSNNFDRLLLNLEGKINPTVELAKWCIGRSNHTLIAILTALTDNMVAKPGSGQHEHRVKQKMELTKQFQNLLGTDGIFFYPAHPTVAPYHNEPLFKPFNFSYTSIINTLGLPATSIPMGIGTEGLPTGLQAIANVNEDHLCLAIAEELESAFGGFKEP